MSRIRVTVLMGGPDAERDVSIASGNAVAEALEQSDLFNVNLQLIDQPSIQNILHIETDVVFPVLHGPFGEGGPLQSLLEEAKLPFVGSCSQVSANAMNKVITKQIAIEAGLKTPSWCTLKQGQPCTIIPPLVIKPVDDGSSVDTLLCRSEIEVANARSTLHPKRSTLLVETFIDGREISVGIIDGSALPIIEILPSVDLDMYDYAAKYERDDTQYIIDPVLPENQCVEQAIHIYNSMGLRAIARVDYLFDDHGAWFLEINTMPGFTTHSLIPMAARHAGIEMPELCTKLVEIAFRRVISAQV